MKTTQLRNVNYLAPLAAAQETNATNVLAALLDYKNATQNMTVRVTDERLLRAAGGIVQGMSGSPILQNGKLVGAVTHVFVGDPSQGYGIFAENMYAYTLAQTPAE